MRVATISEADPAQIHGVALTVAGLALGLVDGPAAASNRSLEMLRPRSAA